MYDYNQSPNEQCNTSDVYYSNTDGKYKYCEYPVQVYNMPDWPGWEEKSTSAGKLFYVDHTTSKTHWKSPKDQGLNPYDIPKRLMKKT